MILYPAVDIRGGMAVRLSQGDFERETVYRQDPVAAALAWVDGGATRLHVVDLDGARAGRPVNLRDVERIARESGVPVQVGGGLRSAAAVEAVLGAGAARVVVGTAALAEDGFLEALLAAHGERVVVSVDARGGRVATAAWREQSGLAAEQVIGRLRARGAREFVYSSIDRDGLLDGPDLDEVRRVAGAVGGPFVYSGGVGSLEDLRALAALEDPAPAGVIVGRALYERRFTVAEARAAVGEA